MQPIHLAAMGGKNEIIDVLVDNYGVPATSVVRKNNVLNHSNT